MTKFSEGKILNHILDNFISKLCHKDKSLLIPPALGEGVAAIDVKNEEIIVVKTDPITFTSKDIGLHAAIINANDIATSGAMPKRRTFSRIPYFSGG